MKRVQAIILAGILSVLSAGPAVAAIYKYVDENGTPSFVDSLDAVPEKHRKKAVLVSGRPESKDRQLSGKEAKSETPEEDKKGKETFINKAKEYARLVRGSRAAMALLALAAFFVLLAVAGKIAESLNQKWLGVLLKLMLTAGLLVYLFATYSKEVGSLFGMAKDLKEEVKGIRSKTEEKNKVLEGIAAEPPGDVKSQK